MSESLISSFLVSDVSESLRSLTKNERCERIAQVPHQKWATMSNLLRSLRGNVWSWANRSGRSPKMSKCVNCSFLGKKRRFAWKTDEQIPSPGFVSLVFLKERYHRNIIERWKMKDEINFLTATFLWTNSNYSRDV